MGGAFVVPIPINELVKPPPLLLNTKSPLKSTALGGVKLTTTLVELDPGTLKELPDTTANGSPLTIAVPVNIAPPVLVTTNVARAVVPVVTVPKSKFAGLTSSCA